jgi:protein-tyrosine phosphatase
MRTTIHWVPCEQGRIGIMPRPRGGDWLGDEASSLRDQGVNILASLLTPEEARELDLLDESEVCQAVGIRFVNCPILDRGVPASPAMFRVLAHDLAAELYRGAAVVIHCRQGVGRASLLAVGILASQGLRVSDAFDRVAAARGCRVPDTAEQRAWAEAFNWTLREVLS